MPVLHVFFDRLCDTAIIIEFFVEGEIQVMDNHVEHEEALAIMPFINPYTFGLCERHLVCLERLC
jgi:hypothetical protein